MMIKAVKAINALTILKRFNGLRNDLDAYLFEVIRWGLGERKTKPKPEIYGLIEE